MSTATMHVSDETFQSEVLDSPIPVLVDFWAEWCAPCRALGPTIDELAADYAGKAKVVKLNIDESQATAVKYGIGSIPTIAIFKGGQVVDTRVGLASKQDLAGRLDAAIG